MSKIDSLEAGMIPASPKALSLNGQITLDDNLRHPIHDEGVIQGIDHLFSLFPLRMGFTSVIIVTRGTMTFRVNLEDHAISKGMATIAFPGSIIERVDYSDDAEIISIRLTDEVLPMVARFNEVKMHRVLAQQMLIMSIDPRYLDAVLSVYQTMRAVIADPNFCNQTEAIYSCLNLLGVLVTQQLVIPDAPAGKVSRREEIFGRFLACVQQNYREHRDLQFYADQLCLSVKYMSRAVYEHSHRHPSQWIREYVILEAKALLRTGRYTVQQVADALNFPNQSFFGKYFKDAVGCSPKNF